MSDISCSIIIINWNSWELVVRQIKELQADHTFDIHIIDNGSTQSLPSTLQDFPAIHFHHISQNSGFSHACNFGFLHARGDYILFLNPDVTISPEQIHLWRAKMISSNLDASSPETQDHNYTKPLPTLLSFLAEFTFLHSFFHPLSSLTTLIGGALFIKRKVYEELGGFDERFFLWFEDSDLTQRLIDSGAHIGRVRVSWQHQGAGSFQRLEDHLRRKIFFHSLYVYIEKHFSWMSRQILCVVLKRFSSFSLLPSLRQGISLVIPNMEVNLLIRFFHTNPMIESTVDEVIVVTSGLDSVQLWDFRKQHPQVRFIQLQKNFGFAHTVNVGMRVARTSIIGTQNDDVESDSSWITLCANQLKNDVGSVNPVVTKLNGEIESAGVRVLHKGRALPIHETHSHPETVDATNAAAVLYSHSVLEGVGLFDERFGSYLEDIDLALRIRKAGYRNIIVPVARVHHHGQATSAKMKWKKNLLDVHNWWIVILKNNSPYSLLVHLPEIIVERGRNLSGLLKAFLS